MDKNHWNRVYTRRKIIYRPFEVSDETQDLMASQKNKLHEGFTDPGMQPHRKAVTKSLRKDKIKHTAKMIPEDVDERDRFMSLRN